MGWYVNRVDGKIVTASPGFVEGMAEEGPVDENDVELQAFLNPSVSLGHYKAAFDAHLDAVAQERQYDNRLSIPTYAGSTNPAWAAEAHAFIVWRDAALAYMFDKLAAVEAGDIEPPTVSEFVGGIEAIVWPALEPNANS